MKLSPFGSVSKQFYTSKNLGIWKGSGNVGLLGAPISCRLQSLESKFLHYHFINAIINLKLFYLFQTRLQFRASTGWHSISGEKWDGTFNSSESRPVFQSSFFNLRSVCGQESKRKMNPNKSKKNIIERCRTYNIIRLKKTMEPKRRTQLDICMMLWK